MTTEQLLLGGGSFLIVSLLSVIVFFLKKALAKLDHLDKCLDQYKLAAEKNFVSYDTWEKHRDETRASIIDLYKEQTIAGKLMAKVETQLDIAASIRNLITQLAKS